MAGGEAMADCRASPKTTNDVRRRNSSLSLILWTQIGSGMLVTRLRQDFRKRRLVTHWAQFFIKLDLDQVRFAAARSRNHERVITT